MILQSECHWEEEQRQDEVQQHDPSESEFVFYHMVRYGDLVSVEKNLKSRQYYHIAQRTPLSSDPVQNFRYHFIVTITMLTRFCIEGGMPEEQAYRISDFYIHRIDIAINIEQIEELHDMACVDFTQRMYEMRKQSICAKPIALCLNYIYSHLYQKITVQTLAKVVQLHPSYLSRLFQIQTGVTIHRYIRDQKIYAAKQLLQFSDRSFAEIANLLVFSSQSHFTHVFSECVGMTPRQYRNTVFRKNLINIPPEEKSI